MTPPSAPLTLALYEPDIAPNVGAMLRTCACLGVEAAIIEPAGFALSDRRLRRSGMDYLDALAIERHLDFERFEVWRARPATARPVDDEGRGGAMGLRLPSGTSFSSGANRRASPIWCGRGPTRG